MAINYRKRTYSNSPRIGWRIGQSPIFPNLCSNLLHNCAHATPAFGYNPNRNCFF